MFVRRLTAAVLAAVLVLLPACSGGGEEPQATGGTAAVNAGMVPRLNMGGFGGGSNPLPNFNPFSPNKLVTGYTFEPLHIINQIDCTEIPWLATGYEWVDDTTLVFDIREGVAWSDGEPFGADDVAYTFNLLAKEPALDMWGLSNHVSEVAASDSQVTFTFSEPATQMFYRINEVPIVPEHVWSQVDDPVEFTNEEPVGTGPFLVKSLNRQQLLLERNPGYWQADDVKIAELAFTNAEGGQQIDQIKLSRGEYDWNQMFVPDIEETYVSRDPEHNHYWFPPGGAISLYTNLTMEPFDDVEFRRGIAHAINRDEIAERAQFGYVEVASQTGLTIPGQEDWLAPDIPDQGRIPFDQDEALRILADAGYERDGQGRLLGPDGQPLSFTFKVQAEWNDWIQAAQIVARNLGDIGINVEVETQTPEVVDQARLTGDFQMTFGVHGGSCNMHGNYADPLASAQTAPIGEQAQSNAVRWQDPETDELIDALRRTTDEEERKETVHGLQRIMLEQFPVIPLWYGANWWEYRTEKVVGWPSEEDPYAGPTNGLLVFTRLEPAE